jgi:hypothetical protein
LRTKLVCRLESAAESLGNGQDKVGPRDEASASDGAEQDVEIGAKKVVVEQDKTQGKKIEIRTEAEASSKKQQNRIVWFGKLEHLVSPGSIQKGNPRTTVPGTAPTPHWCPLGLTLARGEGSRG